MTEQQRTRQMQAIHIEYTRLRESGAVEIRHYDKRTCCHLWATEVLGRLIPTLKCCSDFELNALRDFLNGKDPKIVERVKAEFRRCGIKNPNAWIKKVSNSPKLAWLKGSTVDQMPLKNSYRLLKMLERRKAAR